MTESRRLIDPASCLRLVTADQVREGQVIIVQAAGLAQLVPPPPTSTTGHGPGTVRTFDAPCVVAAKVTSKRWADAAVHGLDAYEIHWEGDEHDWVICKPSALFVVCERPA